MKTGSNLADVVPPARQLPKMRGGPGSPSCEDATVNDTPQNSDRRPPPGEVLLPRAEEETLVAHDRGDLTPSQQVEQKLIGMLKESPLLVSQVQRRLRPGPR